MKKTFYYFLPFMALLVQSCIAQDVPEAPKAVPEAFKACCGIEPVNFTYGKANIYVPNVFTPNGDGINDLFVPSINENVLALVDFTISNIAGDTVLFHRRDIVLSDLKSYGWNGKGYDGKQHNGPFKYGMAVYDKERNLSIIEGRGCVIPCSPGMAVFQTKAGCFYPVQAGKNGLVDKSISPSEKSCF